MKPSLANAFIKLGGICLVFGLDWGVSLAFGYYLIFWMIGGPNDYD